MSIASYVAALTLWGAVHAMWQGALIALVARRTNGGPDERYRSAAFGLAVTAISFIANIVIAHLALAENARLGALGAVVSELPQALDDIPHGVDTLLAASGAFAATWLAGVVLGMLGLLASARQIATYRSSGERPSAELQDVVVRLAGKMGLVAPPQVVLSRRAHVPFVAGRSPGLLVLPASARYDDELEALILHELAHIRRRDCDANIALHAFRLLLWFQPAAWYLFRRAAIAREEACDTDALAHTRALVLARALVNLEAKRHALPAAVGAGDGALAMRIRRLIRGGHRPQTSRTWLPAACIALVFVAGAALSARLSPASDVLALSGAEAGVVARQAVDINAADPAGRFTLALLNGRVANASVAGVPVMRSAIRRQAGRVSLLDGRGESVVALQLDPRGTIHWMPRARAATISLSR